MYSNKTEEATMRYFVTKLEEAKRATDALAKVSLDIYGNEAPDSIRKECGEEKLRMLEEKIKTLELEFEESRRAENDLKHNYQLYQNALLEKMDGGLPGESFPDGGYEHSFASQETAVVGMNGNVENVADAGGSGSAGGVYVKFVSEVELDAVPKYMKGRTTLDQINAIVDKLNAVLEKKYRTLAAGLKGATNFAEKDAYFKYKREESNGNGEKFCSEADLHDALATSEAASLKKVIPMLRHCKRIKDTRCGKETYFIVLRR